MISKNYIWPANPLIYFLDCRVAEIPSFVRFQLERYNESGLSVFVFTFLSAKKIQEELASLKAQKIICDFVISEELCSSFAVIEKVLALNVAGCSGDLYFATAQCFGPFTPVSEIISAREASGAAVWGITLLSGGKDFFVEPYFMSIDGKTLQRSKFREIFEEVRVSCKDVSRRMNLLMMRLCEVFGYGALIRMKDVRPIRVFRFEQPFSVNAADFLVRKYHMPFVPVAAFRNTPANRFPITSAVIEALRDTFPSYPQDLISDYLRVSKPLSWMKSYPGVLKVLGVPGAQVVREGVDFRVAVKAHLFYPEMLQTACDYLGRIPVEFDLLCTTCTDEMKATIESDVKRRLPNLRNLIVAKVPNRGRDIGPWLTALIDEEDSYDVILKYQTKRRLQQSNVFGEAWNDFVNDCILGSPTSVLEILSLFASDERLGIVIPAYPVPVTITTPSAFAGVAEMKQLFEQCRKRLAPHAPPETGTPVFSAGTMFWYRPKALRAMRDAGFTLADFPPEPLSPVTILHALERVIPYVAQSAGFGYNFVLPYNRLLSGYELLEGRLLSSVPIDDHPPLPHAASLGGLGFFGHLKLTINALFRAIGKRL